MWAVSGCYDTVRYKINTGQYKQWVGIMIQLDINLVHDNSSSVWHNDTVKYKINIRRCEQWVGVTIQLDIKLIQDSVSNEWVLRYS